jgi:hypothetical protein
MRRLRASRGRGARKPAGRLGVSANAANAAARSAPTSAHCFTGLPLAAGYFQTLERWVSGDPEPFDPHDELAELVGLVLRGALAT